MISNGLFYLVLSFSVLILPVSSVQAQESSEIADLFYLCKRDNVTRWLRAYKMDNGKCQAAYSKEGYLQVISSATYFSMCEGVLQSVKKNLEEGGFRCTLTPKYSVLEIE